MQQKSPQTVLRGGIEGHVLEPLLRLAGRFGLYIGGQAVVCLHLLFNKEADGAHIGAGIEQRAPGGLSIAACTACFLIITFQILGHVIVDHEPHVGLVDAHAEGIGRHHDLHPVIEEIVLILPPGIRVQLGMVGRSPDTAALQQAGSLIHLLCGAAVDDARVVTLFQHKIQQLLRLLAGQGAPGLKIEVGPVKAGGHLVGLLQGQLFPDVVPHMGGGRGRECAHHRTAGQAVHKGFDAQVAGPEVLSPLADAVGLVHRHHADGPLLCKPLEAGHFQPLRCHIDDLVPAFPGAAQHQGLLVIVQAVVQKRRRHARLHQCPHLILHQADQRRHHDGDARQKQRRHLIADGFTRTGGHHRQYILPGKQAADDLLLPGAEAVVAKYLF